MGTILVTVEIPDAEFAKDCWVDPERPLTELVQSFAKENHIPLRTETGRPISWTAEGPEWRPGKTGTTDLTRTQPLVKITACQRELHGHQSPLFSIQLDIPGAAEIIAEARETEKIAGIEARMAMRAAEREAGGVARREDTGDFTMEPEPAPPPSERPVEQRIKRSKRKAPPEPSPDDGPPLALWIGLGAGGLLLLFLVLAVVLMLSGRKEPDPPPAPPVAVEMPVAIPMTKPKAAPPPSQEAPAQVPMKTFYSRGEVQRSAASSAAAQLTSFAKEEIRLSYKVRQDGAGSHSVSLKGRFTVKISDSGGSIDIGGKSRSLRGSAKVGATTPVSIHFEGGRLRVKVAGKNSGPYSVPDSSSFPAWRIKIDGNATLLNMRAAAREGG